MSAAQAVVYFFDGQSCRLHTAYQVIRMIHFAVPISHGRKIQADMRQAKGGSIGILSVPQCFHNEKQ